MQVISKAEAKAKGLATYFTGQPCKRGGLAVRSTSNGRCRCPDCRKFDSESSRAYQLKNSATTKARMSKWRKENRVELSAKHKEWLNKNPQARAKYNSNQCAWAKQNRAIKTARDAVWRTANPDLVRTYQAKYFQKNRVSIIHKQRQFRSENPDAMRTYRARWKEKNPHIVYAADLKRRAAKAARIPAFYSEFDDFVIAEAGLLAKARAVATGIPWHVDHMIPLMAVEASGLHCARNLQVIPGFLNTKKGNRMWLTEPDEWLQQL